MNKNNNNGRVLRPVFNGVKVVEASAGAGKTFALSRAYLGLLLADPAENNLKSLLAITFTNKATYEMKERILELLKRAALDEEVTI